MRDKKLLKEMRKLREDLRTDHDRIQSNFHKIFLEMDSHLEYIYNSLEGGKKDNEFQGETTKED